MAEKIIKDAVLIARLPKTLKKRMEDKARALGVKISEVTRLACEKYLK